MHLYIRLYYTTPLLVRPIFHDALENLISENENTMAMDIFCYLKKRRHVHKSHLLLSGVWRGRG